MTPELMVREQLASCNQLRAEYHRILIILHHRRPWVFSRHSVALTDEGLAERRKIAGGFLGIKVENMNDLTVEQWSKLNDALKEHFGVE